MLWVGALVFVLTAGAITLLGFRRYFRNRWVYHEDWSGSADAVHTEALVTKMKLGAGNHTVSVFETNGKNRVLIEGPATDSERKRLLRYLKAEGFI